MIDEYIQYYYLVPVGSILILALMYAINNWDASPLEKKLITNFKKLQILVSTIFLESIVISLILYFLIFIKEGVPEINKINSSEINKFLPFILSLFIISLCISLIINLLLNISFGFFSVKHYYYVNLNNNLDDKWYLIRKSNKSQILLKGEKGDYLFLNEWNELIFKQEIAPLNLVQKFLYSNDKRTKGILFSLLLSFITLYGFSILVEMSLTENIILQIITVLLMLICITIFFVRKYVYKGEHK